MQSWLSNAIFTRRKAKLMSKLSIKPGEHIGWAEVLLTTFN